MVQHTVQWLRAAGKDQAVLRCLEGEGRELFASEVFAVEWIELKTFGQIVNAVGQAYDLPTVHDAFHTATRTGTLPRLQPMIDSVVRLFGLAPATLFSRLDLFNKATVRGVSTRWIEESPKGGTLTLSYDHYTLPADASILRALGTQAVQHAWAASFSTVFDVCQVRGTVEPISASGNTLTYRARW